jgi:hypothetical protein
MKRDLHALLRPGTSYAHYQFDAHTRTAMRECTRMSADDPKPQRPTEPDPADCCGGGCVSCVYDLYDVALARYEAALAQWLQRHPDERAAD